jgi:hypothetical protein
VISRGPIIASTPGDFTLRAEASNKNKYEQLYVDDFTLSRASAKSQMQIKECMGDPNSKVVG